MIQHLRFASALAFACIACTASAPAASAHPLDGQDPVTAGCSGDAYTVTSQPIYRGGDGTLIGRVSLRYSSHCGTNWAKVERYDGVTGGTMTARIVRPSDGFSNSFAMSGATSIYGNMAYAPNTCTFAWGEVDESYASGSAQTGCF
jgi:Protein of unknown function (DUF2690)